MNKTKRALLSLIVVSTVFCLTMIFNIQLPFFTVNDSNPKSEDVVSTQSNAYVDNTTDDKIESFSYDTDESQSNSVNQRQSVEDTEATNQSDMNTSPDNSLTAEAPTTENASEPTKGPTEESNQTSLMSIQSETDGTTSNDPTSTDKTDTEAPAPDASVNSDPDGDGDTVEQEMVEQEEQKALYSNIGISIAKDYVNIRKDPSTDGEVLGKLYRNSAATILKTDGDWYLVESGSVKGYAKAEFMKTGIPDEDLIDNYGTQTAVVDVDGLNVRQETSTDSKKLTVIYQNEKYPVAKIDGDWVLIKIDDENISGYVKTEFVDLIVSFVDAVSKEEEQKILQLKAEERAKKETEIKHGDGFNYTEEDVKLLACLVHAEAGTQSYEGKLAVANIVLNRVKSSKYPDSIKSVIYQAGQFSVSRSGSLQKQLDNFNNYSSKSQLMSLKAARDALEGDNNIGKRLYFHTYTSALREGYTKYATSVKLGEHLFW